MRHAVKHQVLVDFVADQIDVAIADQCRQLIQFGTADQRTAGVMRGVEDDHARARAQGGGKLVEIDGEIVGAQLHMHAATASQLRCGVVAVVARVKHDDFVTAVDNCLNRTEDRLGGAGRHGHFMFGIHLHAIAAGDLRRDLLAQCWQAGHRRILVMPTGNVPTNRIAQRLRAVEIRKTLGQVDGAGLRRELRHLRENRDADIRQLTGDHR